MKRYSIEINNKIMWNVTQRLLFNHGGRWVNGIKRIWFPPNGLNFNQKISINLTLDSSSKRMSYAFGNFDNSPYPIITINELRKILRGEQL